MDENVVELTFDQALTVRVDVAAGELRFSVGAVGDPSAPTLVQLPAEGVTAIPGGPLDAEDKRVLNDARVARAYELLAGGGANGAGGWDWSRQVAEAANECLSRLVLRPRE
jgi:hypothetical protein